MKEFEIELSTKVYFGTNICEEAINKISHLLPKRILLVTTGRSLKKNRYVEQVVQYLKKSGKVDEVAIFEHVSPNPRLEEAEEAVRLGKEKQVQMVIGLGGGSALDAAKAAAVGIPLEESLNMYFFEGKEPTEATLPIIAIPTTAGTGSELSRGAILSSPVHCIKNGIRGKNIVPKIAIVDTYFTWTVPMKATMEMGFDVLAHAVESYVAVKANFFSEMISEKIIRIVGEALPKLRQNLDDHDAREKMCFASMIAGMNLATVGTCLPHRMQYVIGAKTDTSHAAGLVALFPAWIYHEFAVNEEKVNMILQCLGQNKACNSAEAKSEMRNFMEPLGLNDTLQSLGIKENEILELAGQVKGNIANDPLATKVGIMDDIFRESF